jgi:hypothetical protein
MRTLEPHLVEAPPVMWRVARLGGGTRFSEIEPGDALSPRAGNRFDVPGGGVLYAATNLEGCYREVLARMRVSPAAARLDEDDGGHMRAGNIAASWRENRRIFAIETVGALPFVDVEHQETWNAIEDSMLMPPGMDDTHLDVGHIRGPNRTLTRRIALWAYSRDDDEGRPLYSGIRYLSRTGDFECWAVFDGTEVVETMPPREITLQDEDLQRAAHDYGLTLH